MPTTGSKVLDHVLVGVANNIQRPHAAGFEVEFRLGKIFQQVAQDGVFLLFLAQLVGVKRNVLEHAFARILEFRAIGFLNRVQGLVNALTVARFMATLIQGIETGDGRQHKAFAFHHFGNQFRLIAVFHLIAFVMILPHIRDVFEEQHGEDEIFVRVGTDRATKGIAGRPQGFVDAVLADGVVHAYSFLHRLNAYESTQA